MAHTCPNCGYTCHFGGDIDDIIFDGTDEEMNCSCCYDEDAYDEDELYECDYCGGCYGTHASDCDRPTQSNNPQQNP